MISPNSALNKGLSIAATFMKFFMPVEKKGF